MEQSFARENGVRRGDVIEKSFERDNVRSDDRRVQRDPTVALRDGIVPFQEPAQAMHGSGQIAAQLIAFGVGPDSFGEAIGGHVRSEADHRFEHVAQSVRRLLLRLDFGIALAGERGSAEHLDSQRPWLLAPTVN